MTTMAGSPADVIDVGTWVMMHGAQGAEAAVITGCPLGTRGAYTVAPCHEREDHTSCVIDRHRIVDIESAWPDNPTMHIECLPPDLREKYRLRQDRDLAIPRHAAHASQIVHQALVAAGYGRTLGSPAPLQHVRYSRAELPTAAMDALHVQLPHLGHRSRRARWHLSDSIWRAVGLLDWTGDDYWIMERTTWQCSTGQCDKSLPIETGRLRTCWW